MFTSLSRNSLRRLDQSLRRGARRRRSLGTRRPRLEMMRLEDRALMTVGPTSQFPVPDALPTAQGQQPALNPGAPPASLSAVAYEGIDYLGSNCGCYPPDTNAAVGNGHIVETVNVEMRIFNESTGAIEQDTPLSSVFGGASTGGDPYVVYDDIANRWYVSAFDSSDKGLFLAVSKDGNPLDGFQKTLHLTKVGGSPDYAKMGFNNDAIFISYNNFGRGGNGNAQIAAINKASALSGRLTYNVSTPAPQFRAMPPAQMHGDTTGGTEWFISTDGNDTGGNTIRVTKMTGYLSRSPTFQYFSLTVNPYQAPASSANQLGGTVTVFPNTTTTQVDFRNGLMVTTLGTADASDGFNYEHAHWYEVDATSGTPTLAKEGVVNPGPGVTAQMPSAALNNEGKIGLTWIQSSSSEYVSMYVGTVDPATGGLSSVVARQGLSFMAANGRIGDYSSVVLDPASDTFWAANEYIGANGSSDIWNTAVAGFTFSAAPSRPLISTNSNSAAPTGASAATRAILATSLPVSNPLVNLASGSQSGLSTSGLEQQVEALVWDQVVFQKNRKSVTI